MTDRFEELANLPDDHGRATPATAAVLMEEPPFERTSQVDHSALPLLDGRAR